MHYDHLDRRTVLGRHPQQSSLAIPAALEVALGVLLTNGAVALWLLFLGRGVLPDAVPLQWWSGSTLGPDNSQHLADFYSALHAVSGAALYFASRAVCPDLALHRRFLLVIACSAVWEMVENIPFVISLFNETGSPGVYRGDSIINALSDSAFVALGFLASHALSRRFIIVACLLAEAAVALMIHDGFVLGTARMVLP